MVLYKSLLMASNFENEFLCPICLEVAEDAVETECCNHAYCEQHAKTIAENGGTCPTCRKSPFRYRPAIIVRRLIGNLPVTCPFCNSPTIQRGNLEDHKKSCKNSSVRYSTSQRTLNTKIAQSLQIKSPQEANRLFASLR